jgi:hypothetical protein
LNTLAHVVAGARERRQLAARETYTAIIRRVFQSVPKDSRPYADWGYHVSTADADALAGLVADGTIKVEDFDRDLRNLVTFETVSERVAKARAELAGVPAVDPKLPSVEALERAASDVGSIMDKHIGNIRERAGNRRAAERAVADQESYLRSIAGNFSTAFDPDVGCVG